MKKLLGLLLVFVMLMTLVPASVFAANEGNAITYKEYVIENYDIAHVQEVLGNGAFVTEKDSKILIILREDLNGRLVFSKFPGDNFSGDFVLDLNGYSINPGELNESIDLYFNFTGTLTITGSGTLKYGKNNTVNVWSAKVYYALEEGYEYYTLTVDGKNKFDERNTETKELNDVDYDVVITQYGGSETNPESIYDYVSFNSNGGTEIGGLTVETGSKITAPEAPSKEGYTFGGWYKESACENEWNLENDVVTEDTTLYAKWTADETAVTYTVTFDANGHGTTPEAIEDAEEGSKITAPAAPTADGYTFIGWYKESSCENAWDFENDTVTGNITLYAKWEENNQNIMRDYLIESYDLANAQSVLSDVADVTEENGALKIVLTSDINGRLHIGTDSWEDWAGDFVLVLNGHKIETDYTFGEAICLDNSFEGSLTITGSGTIKGGANQIVYMDWSELRFALADGYDYFTAKVDGDDLFDEKNTETKTISWDIDGNELVIEQVVEVLNTYTITFDANGGAGTMADATNVSGEYTLPNCDFIAPNGKQFKAWSVDDSEKAVGDTITVTANTTVTAVWENIPVTTYTVTFDANGGSVTSANSTTTADGKLATLPTPTRNGRYIFKGWYTAASGGTQVTLDKVYTENTTIYAQWTYTGSTGGGVSRYTVKFDTNGGTTVANKTVTRNAKLAEPTAPTKDGYTFDGWYTDKELTTAYDFDAKVTKGFTLYAKWVEAKATHVCLSEKFSDLDTTKWYHEDIDYVLDNEIMLGTSDTVFAPEGSLTRGMLVTILYRSEGEPATNRSIPFADVDMGAYYANATTWAKQNGIINGISETEFAPDMNVTREQLATVMFRYAQFKGMDAVTAEENLGFNDASDISDWAVAAMNWGVGRDYIFSRTEGDIAPKVAATRAEIAAFIHRYIVDTAK